MSRHSEVVTAGPVSIETYEAYAYAGASQDELLSDGTATAITYGITGLRSCTSRQRVRTCGQKPQAPMASPRHGT
jgi:hypothetical protein